MTEAKGFWGLESPRRGRVPAAVLLGRPGAYFDAILQASHYVEYYDEEMDFEPFRRGVRTESLAPVAMQRRIRRLGAAFPLLVGYRSAPLPAEDCRRVLFSPSSIGEYRAGDLVLGLRSGRGPGGSGERSAKVITARETVAGGPRVTAAVSGDTFIFIDPLVMDPSLFPVPSNLEPGGLTWHLLTGLLRDLVTRTAVRGVLLLPCVLPRRSPVPPFVLARLLSKILAYGLAPTGRRGRR